MSGHKKQEFTDVTQATKAPSKVTNIENDPNLGQLITFWSNLHQATKQTVIDSVRAFMEDTNALTD